MKFSRETHLDCPFDAAVQAVRRTALLSQVARPVISFTSNKPVPDTWAEETYWFKLRLFGVLPMGQQAIRVSIQESNGLFTLHDAGFSNLIERWDHRITITEAGGMTRYRDDLDIDAGFLTPFVWLFAKAFFRHRQRRLVKLAASGFDF